MARSKPQNLRTSAVLGMPTSMGQQDFEFIVSSGPRLPPDAALRTLIRKQAMKNAGIRRRARGNHNHATSMQDSVQDERTHGPEQPIVTGGYSGDESSSSSSVSTTASPATLESDLEEVAFPNETARLDPAVQVLRTVKSYRITSSHLAINPSEGYEAMRAKYNFDVKDLCFLTNFNIGRSTIAAMAQNPVLLATLLGHQTESYLCHLPGRYGHKPYLTAAIECVTVKAQSMLHPSDTTFSATALRKYAKALRAVQKAVQDDEASLDADLLCAVQMLSLHEVLDPQRTTAYAHHVEGSGNLIVHRSPTNFTTRYEQMLFLAHIGPAFSEALFKKQRCFLAQSRWIKFWESLGEESTWLTERSPLIINVRRALVCSSGLILDTSRALSAQEAEDGGLFFTTELMVRKIHQDLLGFLDDYSSYAARTSMRDPPATELSIRRELMGSALEALCVYKRMLAALCETERIQLETETQSVAVRMFELQKQPVSKHSWTYTDLEYGVALVVQGTRIEWEEVHTGQSARETKLASRNRWESFRSRLVPRRPSHTK